MPGDEWRQFANVRAFLAYMYAHPGKKLLFMGQEIGQCEEWNHDASVPWDLLEFDLHRKLQNLVRELNRLYRANPALYEVDFHYAGFEWVDFHDVETSVIAFLRRARRIPEDFLLFCCNFTPVPRQRLRIRRAGGGLLRGDPQHRFRDVRRLEHGQRRRGVIAPDTEAQPAAQHLGNAAAAGGGGFPQALSVLQFREPPCSLSAQLRTRVAGG